MEWFDVALWVNWFAPWPEHLGMVQAISSYDAVMTLMRRNHLVSVARVAAGGRRGIDRWSRLVCPEALVEQTSGETRGGVYDNNREE